MDPRIRRGAGYVGLGGGALVLLAGGVTLGGSELQLRKSWDVPLTSWSVHPEADPLTGERLARIGGCYDGCHGDEHYGAVFVDEPLLATLHAPNLSRAVRDYSDAELERVIRRGVRPDGRSVWIMPSPMFAHLSDEDLSHIVAFLRSLPEGDGPGYRLRLGPMARLGITLGEFGPLAREAAAADPPPTTPREDALAWGRYLALTACTECHGPDLRGFPGQDAPGLRIVEGYSDEAFSALLRTGRGLGDRELGLMGQVALSRFSYFTDEEVGALRAWLLHAIRSGEL